MRRQTNRPRLCELTGGREVAERQRTTARKSFDPNQGFGTIGFGCAE